MSAPDLKPCEKCDGHGTYPVPNPKRNDPFRTDPFPCEECNGTGYVEISTSDPEHPYSGHSSLWPPGSLASFTVPTHGRLGFRPAGPMTISGEDFTEDPTAARLAQKPHWQQAEVAAFPNGVLARSLAAELVEGVV